jgi:hypothetical protein
MRAGDIIKHKNSMDVCFMISKVFTVHNRLKIKGFWINQGFVKSWALKSDRIEIMKADYSNWLRSTTPHVECLRHSQWKGL